MKCLTNVKTGLESPMFRPCGKPVTQSVLVGMRTCSYCDQHAEEARRWVAQQGNDRIADVQRRIGGQ